MKIKLIGIGQCGSLVVYDVLAYLLDQKESKELRSQVGISPFKRWLSKVKDILVKIFKLRFSSDIKDFFTGQKVANMPSFYVIDGNKNNAMIDGLLKIENTQKQRIDELKMRVRSASLTNRNNGCSYGPIGEYVFRKEREENGNKAISQLEMHEYFDMNFVIFAGGGGSGSGGAVVINDEKRHHESLLVNLIVLPQLYNSAMRLKWNTGRCIMRLMAFQKFDAIFLFNNFSDDLSDRQSVNDFIRELVIRCANFSYPSNLPTIGTDIDKKDLQGFFSGNPIVIGMSNTERQYCNEQDLRELVDRALRNRVRGAGGEGLSIKLYKDFKDEFLAAIKKVLIVVGIPRNYKIDPNFSYFVKDRVAEILKRPLHKIDCEVFSYGSVNKLELTIFFRHNSCRANFYTRKLLDSYFQWHAEERTEADYLCQKTDDQKENHILEDCKKAFLKEFPDIQNQELSILKKYFGHPLTKVN
jgi:cell division GTPase FtsZ